MRVESIGVKAICNGPVEYMIRWRCSACSGKNRLVKRVSLLPPETAPCDHCTEMNAYVYDASIPVGGRYDPKTVQAAERAFFEEAVPHAAPEIHVLGHNYVFGLFAYLSNRLAGRD